jgi:hypothetical protein
MQISKTEYDQLSEKARTLGDQLAAVTKERDALKTSEKVATDRFRQSETDIDRLQSFLSALPDAPPERPEGSDSWAPRLPVPERLAIWIAKRMK